jgi:hypothetical protein
VLRSRCACFSYGHAVTTATVSRLQVRSAAGRSRRYGPATAGCTCCCMAIGWLAGYY